MPPNLVLQANSSRAPRHLPAPGVAAGKRATTGTQSRSRPVPSVGANKAVSAKSTGSGSTGGTRTTAPSLRTARLDTVEKQMSDMSNRMEGMSAAIEQLTGLLTSQSQSDGRRLERTATNARHPDTDDRGPCTSGAASVGQVPVNPVVSSVTAPAPRELQGITEVALQPSGMSPSHPLYDLRSLSFIVPDVIRNKIKYYH